MFVVCDIDSNLRVDSETGDIKPPLIVRVNNFDDESVEKFAKHMTAAAETGQPIIPIVIDSYGGDVYALLAMIDIIKSARVPICTVVQGKAMSCGAVLASCGTEGFRFIGQNATIMMHDVSSSSSTKKSEEIKVDAKETERLNEIFYQTLARNCGKADDYFTKIANVKHHADWYMTPQEAVRHNIVNHIGVPQLNMTVSVTFKLSVPKLCDAVVGLETDLPKKKLR